ncbi:MAG TPA: hypothetical protein VGN63_24720 [Flavisolibacter sp.]|jgi:hypothetical protein|nr:hypothetical protein [Flavisolibacter sp.]
MKYYQVKKLLPSGRSFFIAEQSCAAVLHQSYSIALLETIQTKEWMKPVFWLITDILLCMPAINSRKVTTGHSICLNISLLFGPEFSQLPIRRLGYFYEY